MRREHFSLSASEVLHVRLQSSTERVRSDFCGRANILKKLTASSALLATPSLLTQPLRTTLLSVRTFCPHAHPLLRSVCVSLSLQTTDDVLVASAECPSDDEDIEPCEPSSGGLG